MIEIQAPKPFEFADDPLIFLAGSIEMGLAEKWQDRVVAGLADTSCTILNPRRDDFDPAAKQEASNPYFAEQVNWELDALDFADIILFYFDPNTKAPITLMELGLHAETGQRILVCCPEGFWRRGNVEIVCARYGITMVNTLEELISKAKWLI
jgi:hypothetical protein